MFADRWMVYWKAAYTPQTKAERLEELLEKGWAEDDARAEVAKLDAAVFERCSKDPKGAPLDHCTYFMLDVAKPGDIIFTSQRAFTMMAPEPGVV